MSETKRKACYVTLGCGVTLAAETNAAIYSSTRVRFNEDIGPGVRVYTRREVALIDANLLLCRTIQDLDEAHSELTIEFVAIAHEEPHPFLGQFRQPRVKGHFDPAMRLVNVYIGKVSELKAAVSKYLEILI